ncbi:MAG: tetratricopeptide repeat protein [Anaerolineales bacterium]|nr:tetratricopeptide repeat protein [Anaerolineales bacterium]
MSAQPTGTVTYLFTDIEGSTQRWEHQRAAMEKAFARHEEIMRTAMEQHGGYVYKMIGDAFQVAFSTAPAALEAALSVQQSLNNEPWMEGEPVKVRMALHSGETEERGDDYVGPLLNRVARLMSAAHGGQVLMTQATYELVRDNLPEGVRMRDMGEHRLKDLERPERVYQLVAVDLPQDFPPLKTLDAHPHNLPVSLTSFVGRDRELSEVSQLLTSTRLLTVAGPGGIGKTRLALQVAAQCLEEFDDGVYFVPLAPVSLPQQIIPSVAGALSFNFDTHGSDTDSKTQLLEHLRERSMLLVMDNFEHLVEGADLLVDMLEIAPNLKLMITSRQRLNLQGEWIFEVEGVDYPENGRKNGDKEYAAVRLFLDRAHQVDAHFSVSEQDQLDINHICRLVEGMPLAIELAAGWTSLLSPQEIRDEITRNTDFLVSTQRDIPEKHRSMRAVFNHSWELLSESQQQVLCQLSIFRGGFDRTAAREVAGAGLMLLSDFVNWSLLRRSAQGRYEIHELLRQYAEEKLQAQPTFEEQVRERYSLYYAAFLAEHAAEIFSESLVQLREEIRTERDNIRQAVYWAVAHWPAEQAIEALGSYYDFYLVQGWHEGKEVFNHLGDYINEHRDITLTTPAPVDRVYMFARLLEANLESNLGHQAESDEICLDYLDTIRKHGFQLELGFCLQSMGINAHYRGEHDLAITYLEECISIFKALKRHNLTSISIMYLGYVHNYTGENDQADVLYKESYNLCEREGNLWAKAFTISKMGLVADDRMDFVTARRMHEESRQIFLSFGDLSGEAYTTSRLSIVAYHEGNYPEAIRYGCLGLQAFEKLGHSIFVPICLCRIGFPTLAMGDREGADEYFYQALKLATQTPYVHIIFYALAGIGSGWIEEDAYERAAELFGLFWEHPQLPAEYKNITSRWYTALEKHLPPEVLQTALERGKQSDLDQVVQALLGERDPVVAG